MPESDVAPQNGQQENRPSPMWTMIRSILIVIVIQTVISNVLPLLKAKTKTGQAADTDFKTKDSTASTVPGLVAPVWPVGSLLHAAIYINDRPLLYKEEEPIYVTQVVYGDKFSDTIDTELTLTSAMSNNGSIFAHILLSREGAELDPQGAGFDPLAATRYTFQLNHFFPKRKQVKEKYLLGSTHDEEEFEEEQDDDSMYEKEIVSYWHPNITVQMVRNSGEFDLSKSPPVLREHLKVAAYEGQRVKTYFPIIFYNDFWHLKSQMIELNNSVTSVPLHFQFSDIVQWKYFLTSTASTGFKQQASTSGGTGSELEEFKRVLLETNIWLLGITACVSMLHTLFEFLAFKNDISHFRNKKDNVGISVRSIIANVVMQSIIFLYLLDNNEDTSWMILFGQGSSILVEAWKITKVADVKIEAGSGLLPFKIRLQDKHELSETEKRTQEYDRIAFKYLYMVGIPLIMAYAGYSLMYDTHKSWYSFIIATLVGSVYAYGFLTLVPSIYINYRLKSVAHMPRRAMIYKFLNTFIDDLFAFVIKMPLLHRLATLRDDVIFIIYIIQTFLYRVDYTRVNEFGQGGDEDNDSEDKNEQGVAEPESIENKKSK
ncbi:hypothetical protein CANCADRAFT_56614 [Tortispora caseinolytica NRRL Y-17796]|uniref:Cleft lip and palate transmembrane protein 1 n=1 Tax=Tortispora caseinolytica NRRL Y-17796 TaxID=767744 RepID=A0A1E4TE66_9ASCO|nr:hypothetical protein CANCADRAFT_56614 [Tortispora caseinolytica NRRL Y-17796]